MDIAAWLRGLGLERYAQAFRDNQITAEVLPELTDADLRELGLPLGPRKILLKTIQAMAMPPHFSGEVEAARFEAEPVALTLPSRAERRHLSVMFCDLVGSTGLPPGWTPKIWARSSAATRPAVPR